MRRLLQGILPVGSSSRLNALLSTHGLETPLLRSHGANPYQPNKEGLTVLRPVTASGSADAANMLLQHGAHPHYEGGMAIPPYEVAGKLASQNHEPQLLVLMQRYR